MADWISVEERLPPLIEWTLGVWVWAYDGKNVFDCIFDGRCIDPTKLGINYISGFHSYDNELTDDRPIQGITHWKVVVMPEPPK